MLALIGFDAGNDDKNQTKYDQTKKEEESHDDEYQ